MATNLVVDADGHCREPAEDLTPWMPSEFHSRAPAVFHDQRADQTVLYVEGRLSTAHGPRHPGVTGPFASHITGGRPGERDGSLRLLDMDEEGVDVAVVFGTPIALSVNGLADKDLAGVLCHSVNRWLLEEYLPADPKRLKGVGLIPCQDPAAAAKELDWLIERRQQGVVSAMLPVNVYGINLGDRRFDPIYARAQEAGLPLSVHPQTGHDGQYGVWGTMGAGSDRMEKYSYVHMTAFCFEPMIALMHMIGEGVFDRFPDLRVAFVEGACGWLPFWAARLDEHFEKLRPQWPDCQRKPSEIIRSGQVALTLEPEEEILPYVLETMGESLVMYASDYAHWDSEYPESVRMVADIPGLTEQERRRVLGQNAIEWFGLREDELPERSVWFDKEDKQVVHP